MMSAGAVIAIVAVIVVIGVIVSNVLPPRGTALVVGGETYSVRDVADRAISAIRLQANTETTMDGVIDEAADMLVEHEILRQVAEPLVGPVTDEEIEEALRDRLGVAPEAPSEEYTRVLQDHLSTQRVSRNDLEQMTWADLMRERLGEHLGEDAPTEGLQVNLYVATSLDRAEVEEVRERTLAGEDFIEVVLEMELAGPEEIETGWLAMEALNEDLREHLDGLEAGDISEVAVPPGSLRAVVYFVAEHDPEREYSEGMLQQLQALRVEQFFEEQREVIGVEQDLSQSERDWIARRIESALS